MSRGYCQNCNKYVDEGGFCGECGGKLTFLEDSPASQTPQNFIPNSGTQNNIPNPVFQNGASLNGNIPNANFQNSGNPNAGFQNGDVINGGIPSSGFQNGDAVNGGIPSSGFQNGDAVNGGIPNNTFPGGGVPYQKLQNIELPNGVQNFTQNLQNRLPDNMSKLKKLNSITMVGIVFLALYNIIGLIVSLFLANGIVEESQSFLVTVKVSYFWLWFLFILNVALLVGAVMLEKGKSIGCVVGQGVLWLIMLIAAFSMEDIGYNDISINWSDGVVNCGPGSEISRYLGITSFSVGHLYVIYFWIIALILVIIGWSKEKKNANPNNMNNFNNGLNNNINNFNNNGMM